MLQSNSTNQASSFDVRIDIKHLPLKYSDLLLKELNKTYLNKTLIFQKLKFKSALNVECQCAAHFVRDYLRLSEIAAGDAGFLLVPISIKADFTVQLENHEPTRMLIAHTSRNLRIHISSILTREFSSFGTVFILPVYLVVDLSKYALRE